MAKAPIAMSKIKQILRQRSQGGSRKGISRTTGVSLRTVKKYIQAAEGSDFVSPRLTHLPRKEFGPDLCVMEKEMQIPRSESIARSRRSAREMSPLIEQWLDQGGSQKDFCAFHRLPLAVFSYWLKKYRSRELRQLALPAFYWPWL